MVYPNNDPNDDISPGRRCSGHEGQETQHSGCHEEQQHALNHCSVFPSVVSPGIWSPTQSQWLWIWLCACSSCSLGSVSLISLLCRMIVSCGYFALILNTSNLNGNPYINCFLSGVVEVPAYFIALVLLRYCSRHLCQSSTLFLGGTVILFINIVPTGKINWQSQRESHLQIFIDITQFTPGCFSMFQISQDWPSFWRWWGSLPSPQHSVWCTPSRRSSSPPWLGTWLWGRAPWQHA